MFPNSDSGTANPGVMRTPLVDKYHSIPSFMACRKSTHTAVSQSVLMPDMIRESPGGNGVQCTMFLLRRG